MDGPIECSVERTDDLTFHNKPDRHTAFARESRYGQNPFLQSVIVLEKLRR